MEIQSFYQQQEAILEMKFSIKEKKVIIGPRL
mgnify:CR=1 FL=1